MKFAISLIALMLSFDAHAETWRMATLDWQPYTGQDLENKGDITADMTRRLAEKGITLEVDFLPWKRAVEGAATGKYVAVYPAWIQEVGEGYLPSKAVSQSTLGVMQREESPLEFSSVDELFSKYRVSYVDSYIYPKVVHEAIKKHPEHAEPSRDEESLMKKLYHKRTEAAITDPSVMGYLATKAGFKGLVPHTHIIEKQDLIVSFKDTPENRKRWELFNSLFD